MGQILRGSERSTSGWPLGDRMVREGPSVIRGRLRPTGKPVPVPRAAWIGPAREFAEAGRVAQDA